MKLRNILILLVIFLALGGYFYYSNQPGPPAKPKTQLYVWLIDMDEIQHIEIELPRDGTSQAFIKEEDRSWSFDNSERLAVNMERWGGGIPLILSGPSTSRVISVNTTDKKMIEFGIAEPQMIVSLTLNSGRVLEIIVGDNTPDGINYYVQAPGSREIALVDFTWFEVLARLVTEPPYPIDE